MTPRPSVYAALAALLLASCGLVRLGPDCNTFPSEPDPRCELDGICDTTDPNDIECEPCDYTPDAPQCLPDPCEGREPPPECTQIVPGDPEEGGGILLSAIFAYDPVQDEGRGYVDADGPFQARATFVVLDNRYAESQDSNWACYVSVALREGETLAASSVSPTVNTEADLSGTPDTRTYRWETVTFAPDTTDVVTHPWSFAPCSAAELADPSTLDKLEAALTSHPLTFAWGEPAPLLSVLADDSDSRVEGDLYRDGWLGGGGVQHPGSDTWSAYAQTWAFALDEDFEAVVDEGGAWARVPAQELLPEDGNPARAVYVIETYRALPSSMFMDEG